MLGEALNSSPTFISTPYIDRHPIRSISSASIPAFWRSNAKWQAALRRAISMRPGSFPENAFDIKAILVNVPGLPESIPNDAREIKGYSSWTNLDSNDGKVRCSIREKHNEPRSINLRTGHPIKATLSSSDSFKVWEDTANNGIALIVLAWAYIFNASLAERQGLCLQHAIIDETSLDNPSSDPSSIRLELNYTTTSEFEWWKAITQIGSCFLVEGESDFLPWTVVPESLGSLNLVRNGNQKNLSSLILPTSRQAAAYLYRFCVAYKLRAQCSAALAAVLSLPLQRVWRPESSKIHLPKPFFLSALPIAGSHSSVPPEFNVLSHLMTLSLSKGVYVACLESVLWEPDIPCNLAGANIGPIHSILRPVIQSKNFELLAKILSSARAAPLWLGTALCGRSQSLSATLDFGRWFGWNTGDVIAWTGISCSFMDFRPAGPYLRDGQVSRADIWRLRHDCYAQYLPLQDYSGRPPHGYPPFGAMQEHEVDLELRDHLHCCHDWRYLHWTWILAGPTKAERRVVNSGVVVGTRSTCPPQEWERGERFTMCANEESITPKDEQVIERLSKAATDQMFSWCSAQVEHDWGSSLSRQNEIDVVISSRSEATQEGSSGLNDVIGQWVEHSNQMDAADKDEISV